MRVRDSFDVRTMSVELSDSLSLLELHEYAEDLVKTGRWVRCVVVWCVWCVVGWGGVSCTFFLSFF